jgi:signal transduction histidine kinase/CheY-like chemotaxis protein
MTIRKDMSLIHSGFAEVQLRIEEVVSYPPEAEKTTQRLPRAEDGAPANPDKTKQQKSKHSSKFTVTEVSQEEFTSKELKRKLAKAKEQHLSLIKSNLRLAEVSRINFDFIANMSHELRAPLNAVIGFSEVLQDQTLGDINEKQKEYISGILNSGRRLLSLVDDILDLSTLESGKMTLELSDFPLHESLYDSMMMFKEKSFKNKIALHLDLDEQADISITADQRKLKRIMFNLLSNAVRLTPEGGSVAVSAKTVGDFIEITVADTGRGIKVEDMPKLFQAPTLTESYDQINSIEYEGVELGLVMSRHLVELQGGRIWVKSYFGMGSRFTFSLPLTRAERNKAAVDGAKQRDGVGHTVLLIEDEMLTLAATENTLQEKGYRVLRARDGEEGIKMAQRNPLALIVLDLLMPNVDGFEVINRLRNDPVAGKVPVLILTSMRISAADRARLAGAVWRIAEKSSLSSHEFIALVDAAVGSK